MRLILISSRNGDEEFGLLRNSAFESTMNAFDMLFPSTKDRGAYKTEAVDTNCNCLSVLNLLESLYSRINQNVYGLERR